MGFENVRQALSALRANWLRSLLTLMIVAFGIMAVVGILTAIDTTIYTLADNFSSLGANSLSIRPAAEQLRGRREGRQSTVSDPISYDEALEFKEGFSERATVAIDMRASGSAVIKIGQAETNPTTTLQGIDENYMRVKSYDFAAGRGLSAQEAKRGANVVILGSDLVEKLFDGNAERALGKVVTAGPLRLEVIGVLASKGSSLGGGADKQALIPLQTARRTYGSSLTSYGITASLPVRSSLESGTSEAIGTMRIARRLRAKQDNDFEVVTSDNLLETLEENTFKLQAGAIAIGIVTLFGAAIGLMNIMLVSVTERTREIGIAKALGASRSSILVQFLTEAVVITQLGGIVGIVLGIAVGNVVTFFLGGEFLVPWGWIVLSVVICVITGLFSGIYPAYKASRLDPIESLRYE